MVNKLTLPERMFALDKDAKDYLRQQIELIIMVSMNYSHIGALDNLETLLINFDSGYHKQWYPLYIDAVHIAGDICSRVRHPKFNPSRDRNEDESKEYSLLSVVDKYFPELYETNRHLRDKRELEVMEYWKSFNKVLTLIICSV